MGSYREHVRLDQYTTLRVGGEADYVIEARTVDEVKAAVAFAQQRSLPLLVLGGGSNVLIPDEGYRGVVLFIKMNKVTITDDGNGRVRVTAEAGLGWDTLVSDTVARGLWGLERLSGIPGTVGAAPIQNINAYGASVADTIESVLVYDSQAKAVLTVTNAACRFGYRDSMFKSAEGSHLIVLGVSFVLSEKDIRDASYRSASQSMKNFFAEKNIVEPTVKDFRVAILHLRNNIGMVLGHYNSAGSFFKNTIVSKEVFKCVQEKVAHEFVELGLKHAPWYWELPDGMVKIATAFLLECSSYNKNTYGNKRYNGVVGISPKHSLSIVTETGATASDVISFAELIVSEIKNLFGVTLESEVCLIKNKK